MPENIFGIKSILTASTMTIGEFLTCILCSTLLGFLISLIYIFTHRKTGYSQSYVLTMTMLPAIIAVIILIIGDSVSSALSLAGAFSRPAKAHCSPKVPAGKVQCGLFPRRKGFLPF